jgi:hypothetical protein
MRIAAAVAAAAAQRITGYSNCNTSRSKKSTLKISMAVVVQV